MSKAERELLMPPKMRVAPVMPPPSAGEAPSEGPKQAVLARSEWHPREFAQCDWSVRAGFVTLEEIADPKFYAEAPTRPTNLTRVREGDLVRVIAERFFAEVLVRLVERESIAAVQVLRVHELEPIEREAPSKASRVWSKYEATFDLRVGWIVREKISGKVIGRSVENGWRTREDIEEWLRAMDPDARG